MPASASSPISAVLDQLAAVAPPDPVALAGGLADVLAEVVDPRKRRGVRHRLVVVIAVAVCAVAAGARSFVAISEWVADLPVEVAAALGITGRGPCESTIRRVVQRLDGNRFDALIGRFVRRLCATRTPGGRRRVVALDGKTVRGSGDGSAGDDGQARHLLAVIDHDTRVVLGQVAVEGKSNEITAFTPLLGTLTDLDLAGLVVTADALHTQREHVEYPHARGAHWVLSVKGNQPRLRRQLAELPWRDVEAGHRSVETSHGRRQIRTLKVAAIAAGILFPYATQAIQLTRKTRPATRKGTWRTETVYAIIDLCPHEAHPNELATWIRGHWQIENALHWVRDVTFTEDLSQVRTGAAPQVMASLRNLAVSLHRLAGATNIAAALRHHARDATRPLHLLMIT